MSTRLATYVDRTGKQPSAPVSLKIESADAVKLAKFFAALGFTVEKQVTPEGRQFVFAKATNVELSIFPARVAQAAADWSMTLIVDDAAATAARAEAAGGAIASPVKEIPGGRKCVVASPEGQRVVVAQLAAPPQPEVVAATSAVPNVEAGDKAEAEYGVASADDATIEAESSFEDAASEQESLLDQLVAAEATASFESSVRDDPSVAAAETDYDPLAEPPPPEPAPEPIGPSEEELRWERWKAYSRVDLSILASVRKAANWTALAYAAFFFSTVSARGAMMAFGPQRRGAAPDLTLFYVAIGLGLAGSVASIVGKCMVVGSRVRRASPELVVAALCADGAGVVLSLLAVFPVVRGMATVLSALCMMISGVLFARYLWLVAEAVEDSVGRIGAMVVIGLYGIVVLFLIITFYGFAVSTDKDKELLGVGVFGLFGTTIIVRFVYAIYCGMVAIRLTPPARLGSARSAAPERTLSAAEMSAMPLHVLLTKNVAGQAAASKGPKSNPPDVRR